VTVDRLPGFEDKGAAGEAVLVLEEAPGPAVHHQPLQQAVEDGARQQVHYTQSPLNSKAISLLPACLVLTLKGLSQRIFRELSRT
jgi:hypothetical protein